MSASPSDILLATAATVGLVSEVPVLLKLRTALRGTTLTMAWSWLAAAWVLWTGTWVANLFAELPAALFDQLWYGTGLVALCPPIAVMGARRPMSRVWGWFVLLPLILVLGWPAASAWGPGFDRAPWVLEEPVLAGYALVLFMGIGNYAGTRYAIPALLYGVAAALLVSPLCPPVAAWLPSAAVCRTAATLCTFAAAGIGLARAVGHRRAAGHRLDRVWHDFRDTFGIVWARRIQERLNETARKANWGVLLGTSGFESSSDPAVAEDALRWLLRRFVDLDWINRRM